MSETNGEKSIVEMLTEMAEQQRAASARLETVEEKQQYLDDKMQELVHWQMRSAARADEYRQEVAKEMRQRSAKHDQEIAEIRAIQAQTERHLQHLTQVVRFLGDKTIEFDGKFRRAGEVFTAGEAVNS